MIASIQPSHPSNRLTRSDAVLAVLIGLLCLGLYGRTLATFVLPSDSGEFQVLVHQLGTAHTTGYSTYLILGNLFTRLLPVGDIAYRVNLFSALMGALTVGLVYLAGRLLSGSRSAGMGAHGSLAPFGAAVGLADLISIIAKQPWGGKYVRAVATLVIAAGCLVPLLWPQWDATRKGEVAFTRVGDFLVHGETVGVGKVAQLTTAALPDNAIVFADWNWIWPYYYAAHIEQGKIGTQFIETYPRSDRRGLAVSTLEFVRENIAQRPIYLADRYREFVDAGYTLRPVQMGAMRMWQLESAP